jgi:PAS domain S-box-containing protein
MNLDPMKHGAPAANPDVDFRQLVESLPQLAWTCDSSGACDYLSPQWVHYTGRPAEEQLGYGWLGRLHPEDRATTQARWEEVAAAGLNFETEFRILRHDGVYRWFRTLAAPLRDADGRISRWFGSNTDIDDLKRTEAALRAAEALAQARAEELAESEARFRGVFEHAATGIAIAGLDGRYVSCNPAYAAMAGLPAEDLIGRKVFEFLHPEDRAASLSQNAKLLAGEMFAFEVAIRYLRENGDILWARKHVSLLRDARGRPTHIIVLVADMSEQKRHEARLQLLLHELNHRAKNLLTLIQSVARLTASKSPDDFLPRFEERLQALASAQDLLLSGDGRRVTIDDLLRAQLAHFGGLEERVAAVGESFPVTAAAAEILGMAFHELATNAAKYGALSIDAGRIAVAWRLETSENGDDIFRIEWIESGGPAVSAPRSRGFGSMLVKRMVESTFRGKVEYVFASAGVSWLMRCPASHIVLEDWVVDQGEKRSSPP